MSRFSRLCVVLLPLAFTGCATLSAKFTKGVHADIGYFADTTVAMMRDVNFGFTRNGVLYTKPYFDPSAAEEKAYLKSTGDADRVLKAIARYSLRLVTITESTKSEKEQIRAYADYLAEVDTEVVKELNLDQGYFDKVVKSVRKEKNLLAALRTAQPIINALGLYMEETLNKVTDCANVLNDKLAQRIEDKYSDTIRYQQALQTEKSNTLEALEGVYLTVRKDPTAYKKLLASDQIRDPKLIPTGKPTYEQLVKMSQYLMSRFEVLHRVTLEVEPEWLQYKETQLERERLEANIHKEVKQFMLVTLTWVRAHQKMASGKMKPAEWFDINDAPARLIKAGIDVAL